MKARQALASHPRQQKTGLWPVLPWSGWLPRGGFVVLVGARHPSRETPADVMMPAVNAVHAVAVRGRLPVVYVSLHSDHQEREAAERAVCSLAEHLACLEAKVPHDVVRGPLSKPQMKALHVASRRLNKARVYVGAAGSVVAIREFIRKTSPRPAMIVLNFLGRSFARGVVSPAALHGLATQTGAAVLVLVMAPARHAPRENVLC